MGCSIVEDDFFSGTVVVDEFALWGSQAKAVIGDLVELVVPVEGVIGTQVGVVRQIEL